MSPRDPLSPDLIAVLRRLKLGRMLDTLPDRLTLARQQKMAHQDLLLLVLSDEVSRRDSAAAEARAHKAQLDPTIDEDSVFVAEIDSAQATIRAKAKDEAHDMVRTSIGEYIRSA